MFAALAFCAVPLTRADEPMAVELAVGGVLNVCKAALVHCPVSSFLCDDPKVAVVENGPEGAELKGISPGTTLCSLLGPESAFRRVIRVTVTAAHGRPVSPPRSKMTDRDGASKRRGCAVVGRAPSSASPALGCVHVGCAPARCA